MQIDAKQVNYAQIGQKMIKRARFESHRSREKIPALSGIWTHDLSVLYFCASTAALLTP